MKPILAAIALGTFLGPLASSYLTPTPVPSAQTVVSTKPTDVIHRPVRRTRNVRGRKTTRVDLRPLVTCFALVATANTNSR